MQSTIDNTNRLMEDQPELSALEVIYAISKLHLELNKPNEPAEA